jgi:hypothetical protein
MVFMGEMIDKQQHDPGPWGRFQWLSTTRQFSSANNSENSVWKRVEATFNQTFD